MNAYVFLNSCIFVYLQIFGPVLPIITVNDLDAAVQFINARLGKSSIHIRSYIP